MELISMTVDSDELIVRGIVRPLFYDRKKNRLDRNAFLPPKNRNTVSTYRKRYANEHICKKAASKLKLGESEYCGLAVFLVEHIEKLNLNVANLDMTAEMNASPIDSENNYILGRNVYSNEAGMPFHADLVYNYIAQEGQPNTPLRKYAQSLCDHAMYYPDPNTDANTWEGDFLLYNK